MNHFLNFFRNIYQHSSLTLKFTVARMRYLFRRVRFRRAIKIAYSAKLLMNAGEIVFTGFAEIEHFAVLNAYNGRIEIGDNTYIGPCTSIYGQGNVIVGSNVLIGPGVRIVSSDHSISDKNTPMRFLPDVLKQTLIEDDVWIGANAVILSGVTLGKGSVIGASSVVTKSVPSYAIVKGNPAKVDRYRE